MPENKNLLRLKAYRLGADLSFEDLAAEMSAAGYPMRARALHLALTDRLQRGPLDRTLYKIEQFLLDLDQRQRRRAARARRRKAA